MGGRFSNPVPQFLSDNVTALAGGKLYFYESGTTTPQDTYSDAALTTPNANPVVLDAAGRAPNIFGSYEDTYRVVLKTSADVTVWTKDNVQFADVQQLVTLAQELQEQIDNIETIVTNANPIRNPTTEVITADDSVTLTTSFLPHVCVGIDGRVASNVTAGTMQSGTLSGLGSTSRQAKMAGVSGDSSSIVEWRFRVASAEARRFASQTCSISAKIRQESGLTATTTIALSKADSADNFSAVTLVGSTSSNVPSSTNTTISYAGLAMGDVSNGIELIIRCQPGGAFSTKDFYLTDIKIEIGATATTFAAPSYPELRAEALETSLGVFRDTGTANAIVISTREAVSLYDGLALVIYRPTGNSAALTLNVDGTGATAVVRSDNTALRSGDTRDGGYYRVRYSGALSKWVLENPEIRALVATAIGFIDTTTPASPTIAYGKGVSSVSQIGTGIFEVTLSDAYTASKMVPIAQVYDTTTTSTPCKTFAQTTTTFRVRIDNASGATYNPNTGFFIHVFGELAS